MVIAAKESSLHRHLYCGVYGIKKIILCKTLKKWEIFTWPHDTYLLRMHTKLVCYSKSKLKVFLMVTLQNSVDVVVKRNLDGTKRKKKTTTTTKTYKNIRERRKNELTYSIHFILSPQTGNIKHLHEHPFQVSYDYSCQHRLQRKPV